MKAERWQKIDELFHAALAREGEERAAFLDEACAGDKWLRREVESLIAAHEREGSFIDSPAFVVAPEPTPEDQAESIVGQQVGRYEVLSLLGRGGMGEVYLARDPRLGRHVALKLLPVALTLDRDRLGRFEREARAASSLNHPNVCTIYEVGETEDGRHYITMEYVEGVTLRQQMNDRQMMKLADVLDVGAQIAAALAAAHEAGVIHRDIKPENVIVRRDGLVKVLDFGLAKLTEERQVSDSTAPTRALVKTATGMVMGTPHYMSPEQVRGQEADHRADIFSFGVILYEMLSGRRTFGGESAIEVMNAILKEEPAELSETNAKISPQLERIVRRCLEKKPERRFQSASDLGFALEALSTPSGSRLDTATVPPTEEGGGGRRLLGNAWLAWLAAVLFLIGLLALLPLAVAHLRHAPPDERVVKLSLLPPEKASPGGIALSPDGRRLAFSAVDATGKRRLYLRSLDALAAQLLAGTDGAAYPFWSPDSRFIGFFAEGKLKKIATSGGPPQAICNAPVGRGGAWNRDEVIIFTPGPNDGLYRVSAAGGEPSPLTTPDRSRPEYSHRWPQFLPDGRSFLYFISGTPESRGIYLGSLDSKEIRRLLPIDSSAVYAPPGYLLFQRAGTLFAQAFNPQKHELTGEPFPIPEQVGVEEGIFHTYLTVSQDGMLACHAGQSEKVQLAWFDREGKPAGVVGSPVDYNHPALSPDGKRVAFDSVNSQTSNRDVWLLELARGTISRLTFDLDLDRYPVWSPDGNRIVFTSNRSGIADLYQKAASGPAAMNCCSSQWTRNSPPTGPRTGSLFSTRVAIRRRKKTSGSYRCKEIVSRFRCCKPNSVISRLGSLRTGSGSLTPRMNQAHGKSTCKASPHQAPSGRSRPAVETSPGGGETDESYFT